MRGRWRRPRTFYWIGSVRRCEGSHIWVLPILQKWCADWNYCKITSVMKIKISSTWKIFFSMIWRICGNSFKIFKSNKMKENIGALIKVWKFSYNKRCGMFGGDFFKLDSMKNAFVSANAQPNVFSTFLSSPNSRIK